MPFAYLAALLVAVIAAAGLTIWFIGLGGQTALVIALPVFLIATAALMVWRR